MLDGSRIVSQTWGTNIFVFIYDENGSPIGINYTTAGPDALDSFQSYYFEKNLQGDIVAIYNSSGTKIGSYTYDAWGNVTTNYHTSNSTESFVVTHNPFRYRGYYYDSDTQLYYLQTRYYNPANGRFLNGDSALYNSILGFNLYAYCLSNPINGIDPCGKCVHRLDFWNDCDACGGRTIKDKYNEFKTGITDAFYEIKSYVSNKLNDVKSLISNKLNDVKSLISNEVINVTSSILDFVNDKLLPTVTSKAFLNKVDGVVCIVGGIATVIGGVCSLVIPEPTLITKIAGISAIVGGVCSIVSGVIKLVE